MTSEERTSFYDAVVIGGGPAGLTAGLYLARACYRVLILEQEKFGGQITITAEVVNYPGAAPMSGEALTAEMRRQAENFGAEFLLAEATELKQEDGFFVVRTPKGDFRAHGVILATGAHPRMIGFPGEAEYKGHGIAYCATCDGEFFTGREVFVVGGGFAAAEEAVFLTKYASHVTILIREPDFTCAAKVAEPAKQHEKITIKYDTEVEEVSGDSMLRRIRYRNTKTGEVTEFSPADGGSFGVFVFAGYAPSSSLLKGLAELDAQGYVPTDRNQKTSLDGLYAAGDVCEKNLRQVVTATGDGAVAATELEKYIAKRQKETGVKADIQTRRAAVHTAQDSAPATAAVQSGDTPFDSAMIQQLNTVFSRRSPLSAINSRSPKRARPIRSPLAIRTLPCPMSAFSARTAATRDSASTACRAATNSPRSYSDSTMPGARGSRSPKKPCPALPQSTETSGFGFS